MRTRIALLLLLALMVACGPVPQPETGPSVPQPAASVPAAPATATVTPPPSATPAPTFTPTATATFTPTIQPTYAILRGSVNVERLSCRYGPGGMYLYLYGLVETAVQEIIGRTDTGAWVLTRAPGDTTVCWVKSEYLDIRGDLMAVEMVYPGGYSLPVSPYYNPPYNVQAARSGDQVTISWNAEALRAGDEESPTSPLFVVETWVCRAGQVVFTPVGAWSESITVTDEPGCGQPSHGRVYLSEKHGYAGPSEIPWPQAP